MSEPVEINDALTRGGIDLIAAITRVYFELKQVESILELDKDVVWIVGGGE